MTPECDRCHQPVTWRVDIPESFIGPRWLLYAYGRLLLPDNRFTRTSGSVWGCDVCRTAGIIDRRDTAVVGTQVAS